jgi:hypothetical protein
MVNCLTYCHTRTSCFSIALNFSGLNHIKVAFVANIFPLLWIVFYSGVNPINHDFLRFLIFVVKLECSCTPKRPSLITKKWKKSLYYDEKSLVGLTSGINHIKVAFVANKTNSVFNSWTIHSFVFRLSKWSQFEVILQIGIWDYLIGLIYTKLI